MIDKFIWFCLFTPFCPVLIPRTSFVSSGFEDVHFSQNLLSHDKPSALVKCW